MVSLRAIIKDYLIVQNEGPRRVKHVTNHFSHVGKMVSLDPEDHFEDVLDMVRIRKQEPAEQDTCMMKSRKKRLEKVFILR